MLERLFLWYGKKVVLSVFIIAVILVATALYFTFFAGTGEVVEIETKQASVIVKKVSDINFTSDFSTVGQVQAVSEAKLQTEAGGRITAVNTEIGARVSAGSVIASIENSSERAALLQAEGAYEASVAGATSGGVGIASAQETLESAITSAITTYQSNHIAVDSTLHNDIDDLFQINNDKATGIRIEAKGQAPALNDERNILSSLINTWGQNKVVANKSNIAVYLEDARVNTLRFAVFVDQLANYVNDQDVSDSLTQTEKDALESTLLSSRQSLNGVLQSIEAASVQITNAQKALEQAKIAGSSNTPSAASAQVKIALGSLRAAQANLEKTLVRTPIGGVVNALYLKAGDYVSPNQPAAIIANNNGLEIVTGISEADKDKVVVGQEVKIDDTTPGVVTAIGGAVDPTTGKVSVKVNVTQDSALQNGSTVTITFSTSQATTNTDIIIPLSAIKMTGSGPIAFKVIDGKLAPLPLTLGAIKGDSVVIQTGLTAEMEIVLDARGLKEGQVVTITQ
jgi:RND family efflux transporter MFP subunit